MEVYTMISEKCGERERESTVANVRWQHAPAREREKAGRDQ